jgi:hypothetical protein
MHEGMPGQPGPSPEQVDAEFAAMMGLTPGELSQAPSEDEIHAGLGAVALNEEVKIQADGAVTVPELTEDEEHLVQAFADELDVSPISMTPGELTGYYEHVDTTINPALEAQGLKAIETDEAERERELKKAYANAPIIEARRRYMLDRMRIEADDKKAKGEARKTKKKLHQNWKKYGFTGSTRPETRHDSKGPASRKAVRRSAQTPLSLT